MLEMTDFVSVVPLSSLTLALSLVRGEVLEKRAAALAALNVTSYAAGQLLPASTPKMMFSVAPGAMGDIPDRDEVEAAFESVMAAHNHDHQHGSMTAVALPAGIWLTILKALLPLIPLIFGKTA